MKKLLPVFALVAAVPTWSAEPDSVTRAEIAHLLHYLESSACQFQRNGSWYGSARAASHLNQKYEYLLKRGLITSTEVFIENAATESSVSGKPYSVKCGDSPAIASADWFRAELSKYRASGKVQ